MAGGRPTIYDPAFVDRLDDFGEGESKAEMAAALGIARSTFDEWENKNPQFSEAVKAAVARSQAWWERKGRVATFGEVPGFNATSFIFNMKNRFPADWKDRQVIEGPGPNGEHTVNSDMTTLELARQIAFTLTKAAEEKT